MNIVQKTKTKKDARYINTDNIFNAVVIVFFCIFLLIILYPLIFIISSSFSSGNAVSTGRVLLWPVDVSVVGYKLVFAHQAVWTGYRNTIIYTVGGTLVSLIVTSLAAYPLSRRNLQGRKWYLKYFMIPMFFGGGLVPTYLLMSNLGLVNNPLVMIIGGALSLSNMTMMRTFFQTSIPNELLESAKMDGVSDAGYFFKFVVPLSKTVYSVIALYCIVGHWNSYFSAMLYLRNRDFYPLQLILKDILNATKIDYSQIQDAELIAQLAGSTETMKFALVIVAAVPMLILYPFVQKFFEKGVMIGSLKG